MGEDERRVIDGGTQGVSLTEDARRVTHGVGTRGVSSMGEDERRVTDGGGREVC